MLLLHFFALLLSLFRFSSAPAGDPPADDPPTERTRATDVLARYGDNVVRMAEKVAELEGDLYKARRSRDDFKRENEEIKKHVTPDGATVLSAADKARWDAYVALGKPEELTQRLTEGDEAKSTASTLQREKTLRTVAEDTGLKPGALATVDKLYGGLTYEVKTSKETVNGKQVDVKRAYVKRDDKEVALTELVKTDYPDLAPILSAEPVAAPAPNGTPTRDRFRPALPDPTQVQQVPGPNIRL